MSRRRRRPRAGSGRASGRLAHYAAPVAFLAGVTIAVLLVHAGLSHRDKGTTATVTTEATTATHATTTQRKRPTPKHRFYVVQSGDTFGTIAAKTGVSVERLQALNPGVSTNALQVGQKIRIE